VAGAVGLLKAVNPNFTAPQMRCALCEHADRRLGGPYTDPSPDGACGLRNDSFGCGFLDLQDTMLGIPWVVRIEPSPALVVASRAGPIPCRELTNPYLNVGMWELRLSGAPRWAVPEPVSQVRLGQPSSAKVCVDREILIADSGPIQSGSEVRADLAACSLRTDDRDCPRIELRVRFWDSVFQALLPRLTLW
jgi:hypothetical protein